jgi:hypothetical protein
LKRLDGRIDSDAIDPRELRGKRADQVLTELFELTTTRNPGSSDELVRMVKLRSLSLPSEAETRELADLEARLTPAMKFSETEFERKVDEAVGKTLDALLEEEPRVPFDSEVRRQLRELFSDREAKND